MIIDDVWCRKDIKNKPVLEPDHFELDPAGLELDFSGLEMYPSGARLLWARAGPFKDGFLRAGAGPFRGWTSLG